MSLSIQIDADKILVGTILAGGTALGAGAAVLFGSTVASGIICGGLFIPVSFLTYVGIENSYPSGEDTCRKILYLVGSILASIAAGFALCALLGISVTLVEVARIDLAILAIVAAGAFAFAIAR